MQSNNGKGECWILGFAGPMVTELLDLIACFVSVVTLYKKKQYGTWGTVRGVIVTALAASKLLA